MKKRILVIIETLLILPILVFAQSDGTSVTDSTSSPQARETPVPTSADTGGSAPDSTITAPAEAVSVPRTVITPTPAPTTSPSLAPSPTPSSTPLPSPTFSPAISISPVQTPLATFQVAGHSVTSVVVAFIASILAAAWYVTYKAKIKKNDGNNNRCDSIKELLEQKKKELEEMVRKWPEEKIKAIAKEKVLSELKKDEDAKKVIETAEDLKKKHDKLKETIEILQKKYDLCMLELPKLSGKKYVMRIIEGALTDPKFLDKFSPKKLEYFDDKWKNLLEVDLTLDNIKEVQKMMVKHYEGPEPWYMDGQATDDKDEIICAFGADDGENGKIFKFKRDDKNAFQKVKEYALSKGIPEEEIDFLK